jgi:serine/threonine protein kinase
MEMDLAAALADRYRIERVIGAGGMATVWLAEDLKHHRQVAVKVLRPELAAAIGPERFLREIEVTARLRHPHILPLFDSGEAAGTLYYVMPFIGRIARPIVRGGPLAVNEALAIADDVAAALTFAHAHGVVHRDIKPENILLEDGEALVADFGISLALNDTGGARLTATGLAVGTPAYEPRTDRRPGRAMAAPTSTPSAAPRSRCSPARRRTPARHRRRSSDRPSPPPRRSPARAARVFPAKSTPRSPAPSRRIHRTGSPRRGNWWTPARRRRRRALAGGGWSAG